MGTRPVKLQHVSCNSHPVSLSGYSLLSISYIFGGRGFPPHETGYDDIYILTIPSFQWIRGPYPGYDNGTGAFPKSMMSCNVVDNAQMLVIGGSYANDTKNCDVPSIQGAHNMNLGEQNEEKAMWARYQNKLTTYHVPTDIVTAIGGSSTGGATKTTPVSGFDAPDLEVLMERTAKAGTRKPTRATSTNTESPSSSGKDDSSSSSLSTGAIAGIAVGCSVAGILALAGCGFFFYRRRKHYSGPRGVAAPPPQPETPMAYNPMSPGQSTSPGGWDPNHVTSPAPSYAVQTSPWQTHGHTASELTGTSGFKSGVNAPVELAADGNFHEANPNAFSPASHDSPQNQWPNHH